MIREIKKEIKENWEKRVLELIRSGTLTPKGEQDLIDFIRQLLKSEKDRWRRRDISLCSAGKKIILEKLKEAIKKRIMKIDFSELILKTFVIELLVLAGILLAFLIKLIISW